MKKTISFDNTIVEYSTENDGFNSCYIKEYNLHFSTKVEDGIEEIKKKARVMILSWEHFMLIK